MGKRKEPYREYIDEQTGEVCFIQSTRQVRREHQARGKWYKEPTEAELRVWERDEQRQAKVDKEARRLETKKKNAVKRQIKNEKDREIKRREFEAGRITFTQTLAKKDEDQTNLHSWFGRGPSVSRQKHITPLALPTEEVQPTERQSSLSNYPPTPDLVTKPSPHGSINDLLSGICTQDVEDYATDTLSSPKVEPLSTIESAVPPPQGNLNPVTVHTINEKEECPVEPVTNDDFMREIEDEDILAVLEP